MPSSHKDGTRNSQSYEYYDEETESQPVIDPQLSPQKEVNLNIRIKTSENRAQEPSEMRRNSTDGKLRNSSQYEYYDEEDEST